MDGKFSLQIDCESCSSFECILKSRESIPIVAEWDGPSLRADESCGTVLIIAKSLVKYQNILIELEHI